MTGKDSLGPTQNEHLSGSIVLFLVLFVGNLNPMKLIVLIVG